MHTGRILKPGQPGTKKLVAAHGEKLVCVRYRYDPEEKRRVKTVELIIDDVPWEPPCKALPLRKTVNVRIRYGEIELGRRVKAAGGKWDRTKQAWELPYQEVLRLGLTNRIIDGHNKTAKLEGIK